MSRKCNKCGSGKLDIEGSPTAPEPGDQDWWSDDPMPMTVQRVRCRNCNARLKLFSKGIHDRTQLV